MRCVTAGRQSDGGTTAGAKSGGGAGRAEAVPSLRSAKLLTSQLKLATDELRALLSESSDFTVIGVLGRQGVGKSTIMSLLAGWESGGQSSPDGGCHGAVCTPAAEAAPSSPPFATGSLAARLRAEHETSGVDVIVTPERLILLDTQPLLSSSVLLSLRSGPLAAGVHTHENQAHLHDLRLAMFILSVAHTVVVVQDCPSDVTLWRLLRTAQAIRHATPGMALSTGGAGIIASGGAPAPNPTRAPGHIATDTPATPMSNAHAPALAAPAPHAHAPAVAFVLNRLRAGDGVASRRAVQASMAELFSAEALGLPAMAAGPAPLVFGLPCSAEEAATSVHGGYRQEAAMLRDELLSLRHRPLAHPELSEREWLREAGRVWELLRTSRQLDMYNRGTHKLHLWA